MSHTKFTLMFLSLLLCGGFSCFVGAQVNDPLFSVNDLPTIKDIYQLDTRIQNLPFVVARNAPILAFASPGNIPYRHPAADTGTITDTGITADTGTITDTGIVADTSILYEIDTDKIDGFLSSSTGFDEFYHKVRIDILNFLIQNGYSGFDNRPYQDGDSAIVEQSGDFIVQKDITGSDSLDILLNDKLTGFKDTFGDVQKYGSYLNFKPIDISVSEYNQLGKIFLFKNEQDIRDLGYELISRRSRANNDTLYRRQNIQAAFHNIGNVRLIMPGETFSTSHEFRYKPFQGDELFVTGYAILGGSIQLVYGGGLCGATTALYQGSLTNLGLALMQYRAHSIYYNSYYNAEINGVRVSEPGLDATVYASTIDVKVKNIRDYPIVAVFNYDGLLGHAEQMFTLSKVQDKGSFEYIGSYTKGGAKCFTRRINGVDQVNCYHSIQN